jgi:serine/threonine-protein kinase
MPLSAGTRVGAYEIAGLLGAGGMGEVYRARDTRLNRDVAIKALPQVFSILPDRSARFEREAHILASLNHPNIAGIYGMVDLPADAGSHGTQALVMELVPGESLDKRLAAGPVPVPEALDIARQIADAVEAAHEKGIVHRDLKPANVMLGPDGRVKVLDFGLAKALEPESAVSGDAAATITSPMTLTQAGIMIGTAAYMSPEQAKGRPVDKRSDVWAFGCVLYELLTGRRAFAGEDVAETIAAILRADPDWSALPPLPPAVAAMLRRCLERDPRRRIADMSTVRFVLDHADVLSGSVVARVVPAPPRSTIRWLAPLAMAVLAIVAFAVLRPAPAPPAGRVTRFIMPLPAGQMLAPTRKVLAIAPDGNALVYVADNKIYLRRLSDFVAEALEITDGGLNINSPAFSPDGKAIAFHSQRGIKRVDVRGGTPVDVCEMAQPITIDWDGQGLLVGQGPAGVTRCNPSGGPLQTLVKAKPGEVLFSPQMLPGGTSILYGSARIQKGLPLYDAADVIVESLNDGKRRILVQNATDARLMSNGNLVYVSGGVLFAVRFNRETLSLDGNPTALVEGIRRAGSGTSQFAISDSGMLVYVPGPVGSGIQQDVGIVDRSGTVTHVPISAESYSQVRVSRDGKRVAIGTDDGKTAIVWEYDLAGNAAMRRVTLRGNNRYPIWSPDGVWIAFQSDRDGDSGIYRQRVDGTGSVERLTTAASGEAHIPESWSPDGRTLLFSIEKEPTPEAPNYTLWALSLPDKHVTRVGDVGSTEPPQAVFSPDGRWIAYSSGNTANISSPDNGIFVQPFPPTGAIYQAPRQIIDFQPVWRADGKELIFIAGSTAAQMAAIPVSTADGTVTFGTPTRFPAVVTGDRLSSQTRAYDILPDGRFIGIVRGSVSGRAPAELRVILNWPQALQGSGAR